MPAKLDFNLKQFDELDDVLNRLGDKVTRSASAAALRAGGKVITTDAKQRLPSNYRSLKKSLGTKILRARDPFNRTAIVGPRTSGSFEGWYGHIVEFGTLASRTEPLAPRTRRKKHRVPLPTGLEPKPFMRPAIDTTKQKVMLAMAQKMREFLMKKGLI